MTSATALLTRTTTCSEETRKTMQPVVIPDYYYTPSCGGDGAEYDHAPIHLSRAPPSSSPPAGASATRKRRRTSIEPLSATATTATDDYARKVSFVRTVSDTDVTNPIGFTATRCDDDVTASRRKRTRRVQFNEGAAQVKLIAQLAPSSSLYSFSTLDTTLDPVNKLDLWYSRSELVDMKNDARRQTRLQRTVSLDSSLSKVYMNAKNQHLTTGDVIHSALELVSNPLFGELRGLERWGSDTLALSRGTDILHAKAEVLLHQSEASSSLSRSVGVEDRRHEHNAMAEACAAVNEPAQKYAQVIGLVDYLLAQE